MTDILNPLRDPDAAASFTRHLFRKLQSENKLRDFLDFIESIEIDFDNWWWECFTNGMNTAASECDHLIHDPITGKLTPAHEWGHIFCPKCGKKL